MKLNRVLKEGMNGDDVKHMQTRLMKLAMFEYHTATGKFGSITKKSVEIFQSKMGLVVDGVVGEYTWDKLFPDNSSNNNHSTDSKSKVVKSNFKYTPSEITQNGLEIYNKILEKGEYLTTIGNKKTIYLHHTAGSHRPDWVSNGWDKDDKNGKPRRIGTAYIIGRSPSSTNDTSFDGKVFKAFDDKYWAYHLGVKGTSGRYDKSSIGIEVCNYGYCKLVDGKFINYVGRELPAKDVVDLGKPFRGYQYWERYTDVQIESLRKLILQSDSLSDKVDSLKKKYRTSKRLIVWKN